MMQRFARGLVDHPFLVLGANLLVTLALGSYALQIRIESSLATVLPDGDPQIDYYAKVRETFGSDDVAVIGVRADDVFAPDTIRKIARVTDALGEIEGVERVLSITNAVDPAADVFKPPPLLPRIPPLAGDVEALEQKLRDVPLYRKNLVAEDFKGAAINVFLENLTDTEYSDLGIDVKIETLLREVEGPEHFYFTGAGHVTQAGQELMRRDLARFTPVALALVLLAFWLSFWTVRGVVLPALSVVTALAWTLGVMVLVGKDITIGTFVLPPLLLVVGSSYGIHMMARYYEQIDEGAPGEEIVARAFERVWPPLLISGLTTAIGFGSLAANRIVAIRDLGLFAMVGIACVMATSLTMIPAALQLMSAAPRRRWSGRISPILSGLLTRLGERSYASRRPILAVTIALSLAALAGAALIEVDSNFLHYFRKSSDVRVDNEIINREIVGVNPFFIVIESKEKGALQRWEVLKEIRELEDFLARLPGVSSTLSLVDYLELLEKGLQKGGAGDIILDDEGNIVPPPKPFWEDPSSLDPVLEIVRRTPETFRNVVTPDFRLGTVLVRTTLTGSREIEAVLAQVREYARKNFPPKLDVRVTGNLVLLTGTASDIVAGQVRSLAVALFVIFVVMSAMFLSVKVGFLAILPNALSIGVFFGIMGWGGILLNLGTSLIAVIALGIAVDSTIHFMARLNLELKGVTDQLAALTRTVRATGAPILYASAALLVGFLTFAFSSFVPIQYFGILASITMLTALAANLVMLPALLATTRIITVWDLVSVKLGRDAAAQIPLFAGLRPAQARIVALMGEIKRFDSGETIIRRGELGEEMYVILQGTAEVWAGVGGERRKIAEQRRGEVFGEMGLVRHHERSADVVAQGEVEVLAVDSGFLERIQRRYPRIASKVFLNLTRILSDRLQRMTDQFVAVRG